ncbi:MAG: hypothetical protein ACOYNP_17750 [Gemmataceae bacterium]
MKNPEADQPYPDDWDDLFRQRFAEFPSEPPANALARILASLPHATPAFDRRKAWLIGGLGVLLFLSSFWFVSQYTSLISTRLTTKSIEARQPTKVSAEQTRNATTASQKQRSGKASKPLTNKIDPEAVTPNKSVTTSDDRLVSRAQDKTVINSENKTGIDLRSRPETSPRRQEALAAATSKTSSATSEMDDATNENAATTEVGTNRPKTIVKPSRTSPQLTTSAGARHSTGANKALLTSKNRVSEVNKLVGTELSQQTAVSPTWPQTGQQQPDQQSLFPKPQAISLAFLTNRPLQPIRLSLPLPDITLSSLPQSVPQQTTMSRKRPVVMIGLMPLYTYHQITPVATDAVWVKNVRSQGALSGQRAGLRLQAGVEWPLSQRLSIRTSLIYNQLNQQVSYNTPSDKPDSIRVERVDDKTVRLTPYYSDTQVTRQAKWHYVGIGSDLVWQIGKLGAWRHYASAGASVGTYLTPEASQTTQPLSGFVQAAYGVERPLTPSVWLRIAPTIQYGLSTISDSDGLFHIRPYTYGVTISLRK